MKIITKIVVIQARRAGNGILRTWTNKGIQTQKGPFDNLVTEAEILATNNNLCREDYVEQWS